MREQQLREGLERIASRLASGDVACGGQDEGSEIRRQILQTNSVEHGSSLFDLVSSLSGPTVSFCFLVYPVYAHIHSPNPSLTQRVFT